MTSPIVVCIYRQHDFTSLLYLYIDTLTFHFYICIDNIYIDNTTSPHCFSIYRLHDLDNIYTQVMLCIYVVYMLYTQHDLCIYVIFMCIHVIYTRVYMLYTQHDLFCCVYMLYTTYVVYMLYTQHDLFTYITTYIHIDITDLCIYRYNSQHDFTSSCSWASCVLLNVTWLVHMWHDSITCNITHLWLYFELLLSLLHSANMSHA